MAAKLSQKEYLKKYLSGGGDKKKKKKDKKTKTKSTTVKIIDDDMHGDNNLDIDEELLLTGEDAPQIVGIYDANEQNGKSKWKSIGADESDEQTVVRTFNDDDRWGKKATSICLDKLPALKKSPDRKQRFTDQSPPRRQRDVGFGKRRFQESETNMDQSPPRKRSPIHSRRDSDQSPRRKHSPPYKKRGSYQSPGRNRSPARNRKGSDLSPPRRRSPVHSRRDSDQSPPRASQRMRNSDQSPPRHRSPGRNKRRWDRPTPHSSNQSRDLSPIRIKREPSTDQSPPRRRVNGNPFRVPTKVANMSIDNSPQRRRPRRDSDQSPVRIKRERQSNSPPPTHRMSKNPEAKRVGLQDVKTLTLEAEERRRNEDKLFKNLSSEVSGRNAEVQVRKHTAYRHRYRRNDDEDDPEVQRKKAEHEQKKKELYDRWNRGLKQIEDIKAKVSDDRYESNKPLARYSDDADLEQMLKQKERADDPMLEYMRSRKKEQQVAVPEIPKYKGSFPENRYNVAPGYRWDGVDRSNGYESKWFKVQNEKKALKDDAYKYSTEDM